MLKNPYKTPGVTRDPELHLMTTHVSHDDYWFFKKRFCSAAIGDKLLSNLFKTLIDELRYVDSNTPLEPAWHPEHPNYELLESFFARLRQHRDATRSDGPRHDERPTSGVHQENEPHAQQRTESESSTSLRIGTEEESGEEGRGGGGASVAGTTET